MLTPHPLTRAKYVKKHTHTSRSDWRGRHRALDGHSAHLKLLLPATRFLFRALSLSLFGKLPPELMRYNSWRYYFWYADAMFASMRCVFVSVWPALLVSSMRPFTVELKEIPPSRSQPSITYRKMCARERTSGIDNTDSNDEWHVGRKRCIRIYVVWQIRPSIMAPRADKNWPKQVCPDNLGSGDFQ